MSEEAKYNKEELKRSQHFKGKEDIIEALLEKDCEYTVKDAEKIILKFMKGRV